MIDSAVLQQLIQLMEKLTDKRRLDMDEGALKQLKLLCRASDDNVASVFDLVMDRLASQDAQVRGTLVHGTHVHAGGELWPLDTSP